MVQNEHINIRLEEMLMLRSSYYLQQLQDLLYIAPVVLIAIMGYEFDSRLGL